MNLYQTYHTRKFITYKNIVNVITLIERKMNLNF